jgi:threonine/homoserine/homoserine lactone efflux protein
MHMTLATWLAVASVCALGAMSPGPSLAVIMRHTLKGGRHSGYLAALTHGAGLGLYAMLAISGVAFVIIASPGLYRGIQFAGAAYLIWLGIRGLMAKAHPIETSTEVSGSKGAARDGFLIAFLNPKIAVFLIALFSQVIGPDTSWLARMVYAATAWIIDTVWYLLVAWLFSTPKWLGRLQKNAVWFERLFGVILLLLAARLLIETVK